ncbi:hypothetical protein N657DRAFT_683129 [Parathielavia appendiculata]|uniref:Heterokaryon incompatibility domain-containing protein n=1 Tax=Parathielavia appendiculata TaxID=2587402 RepID=A0AAN6TUJ1_9PEZI|nr:hypothetical protein N657DRAFT_683129 [Parathielavia appendiculata]
MLFFTGKEALVHRAVRRLFGHAWFRRIWIVHEVGISNEIHVIVRGIYLDWETLRGFVEWVNRSGQQSRRVKHAMSAKASSNGDAGGPYFFLTLQIAAYMSMMRHQVLTMNPLPLATLMMGSYASFASTDPRDKVFALLALAYGSRSYHSILAGELTANSALCTTLPSWVLDYSSGYTIEMRTQHLKATALIDPSGTVTVLNEKHRYQRRALLLSAIPFAAITQLNDFFQFWGALRAGDQPSGG